MSSYCKPCAVEYNRDKNWYKLYGITREQYFDMLDSQHGVCAICLGTNANGDMLSVDHDHATGGVRKLLCHNCNLMLGNARDREDLLMEAIEYLRSFS